MKQFDLIKSYLRDKYQDEEAKIIHEDQEKIIINNPHVGKIGRILFVSFGLPFFCVALLGIYNGFHDLFLNPIDLQTGNIILGSLILLVFLGLSSAFLIASTYPDKKLIINSDKEEMKLILNYPFSIEKVIEFSFLEHTQIKIFQDYFGEESNKRWRLEIILPDKHKLGFWTVNHLQADQKERAEYWQNKIQTILKNYN